MPHSLVPRILSPLPAVPSAMPSSSGGRNNTAGRIAAGDTSLRFVAEGDSWFHYPIVLRDTLDWLSDDYAIFDLAAAGDTLENMKRGILNIIDVIQRDDPRASCSVAEGMTSSKASG